MLRKILIVDDLATNRRMLGGMLCKAYDILEAASGEQALDILLREYGTISAVLLDISMPGIDGFEVLGRIRSDKRLVQLPVIMITGSNDEETRVKSLALGANDFVMKPYSMEIIQHCLKNNIALREAAATVSTLQKDSLTGVWNRETFFEKAAQEIEKEPAGYFILGCVDIDNFKVVNDQYGSETGDRVLKSLANALQASCDKRGGICGRVFADGFIALYPCSLGENGAVGPELMEARIDQDTGLRLTLSVGRYIVTDKSLSVSAMYDRAAIAQRTVKGRYDRHVAVYDEQMRDRIMREQSIVNDMNTALRDRQFEVWFQPQYNYASDAMIGAEALVRWRHPEKGLISPADFIPIFEQNGFIYSLDKFVWEETCRCLRKWIDEDRCPLPVSVNISRYDVFQPDMVPFITGLVAQYALPIDLLRLEITESAFSESSEHIVTVVKALLNAGFTVEIDDFGSGYSSLNTLKDVPAQIIKLDMKFLASSSDSERGGNIVESVVRMAKWLGVSVIAEGVETREQADYLRSIGCNYMQGYLFARPMPAASYEAHCEGSGKEEYLLTLETVENLNNNAFWDPKSMDTLIFNSYIGCACIYEYFDGKIELLRATPKYAQMIGSANMTIEDALKLDFAAHLDAESRQRVAADLAESIRTKDEVTSEYVFLDLPGCPHETYLRSTMRVIASAGARHLVYCMSENITAQRKTEERNNLLNEQVQAIMRDVDCGITAATLDDDGRISLLFTNDKFFEIHGYTRTQYETEVDDKFSCVYPEDREKARADTVAAYRARTPVHLEYRLVRRDGSVCWVRVGLSSTRFTGIERNVHLCIFTDITAEKQAEQEKQTAAMQLQRMMDDMPGGFVRIRVEPDGRIKPVYFNDGLVKLLGMDRAALLACYGDDVLAGVYPDDVASVKSIAAALPKSDVAHSSRYRLRHGSGGYVWLSTFERATRDEAGNAYINIYFTDTTQRVQEEAAQRSLLDNLPCGAGEYELRDGQMSLVYQNKSYWELVGLNEEAYPDSAPMSAIHPDDIPVIMQELSAAIQQNRDVSCDIRLRHLVEGYRSIHLAGRIVRGEAGAFLIYATFARNSESGVTYQQMLSLLLSAMMDSTSDLAFAKDREFRYLSASRAFLDKMGVQSAADLIGKTDRDLFPAALAEQYRQDDEALLESGSAVVDKVEQIPSDDGTPHYSSTSKYVLRDGSGEIVGLYGVGRDITKTVRQNSQLQLVNDSIPGGLATYAVSENGIRIAYCNDGFCKLFGGTRAGFEARGDFDPLDWVFEEDRAELVRQIDALARDNTPMDCVLRVHVIGGGYKWINERAAAAERRSGVVLFHAVLLDITEQQDALEQLRISEEESNLATTLSGNSICRYSVADRTLTFSPEVAAAYSMPELMQDVPEAPVRDGRIAKDSAPAYNAFFASILRGDRKAAAVFQQRYRGGWQWIEAKSATIYDNDGKPVKAVISFVDITERLEKEAIYKKWQQSLAEKKPDSYSLYRCNLNNDAAYATPEGTLLTFDFDSVGRNFNMRARAYTESRVFEEDRERYAALVNADVMLASYYRGKRADALEYRELLPEGGFRWLRLTIELVENPNGSDVEAYLLYEDIDAVKREELKTQQQAESDPLTGLLNRKAFTEKFDKLVAAKKRGAGHGLSALFIVDLDGFKLVNDSYGHAVGDETLIELGQKLRGAFREQDLISRLGGDEFMIYMSDVSHTSAIRERAALVCALLHKSFSIEVQLSASIGISVCPMHGDDFETLYRKADLALYHVKAMGKDGYALYEEAMHDEALPEETERTASAALTPAAFAAPKRRMLIVEDNEINRDFLTNLFSDTFIVDTASEGTAALIRLRRYGSGISVVLLDLMMPGLDGFAVLKKMRENPAMQSIPVIVVSGMNERETCLEAIRNGASDYITKPVDADLLKLRVASAISKSENEQLRAQNRYLAIQNEETKRLAEAKRHSEELSLALHAAERADLAKSQFLSSMSHEIRTPLNAVIGYNTIARNEMAEAKTAEERRQANMKVLDCLTKSEVASRHLLTIINDVLDLSAIESGKMKVDESPFDFRGLITSLTVMFFSQARAKGVNFEVLFEKPTEEWFVGDQLRINQVLTNLLSNAVKFTPEGGSVTLSITENVLDDKSTGFCFVVSDTGIGMTQEYLTHIWTPFEQAEASISRRFGGTGLGLSITKNLVGLMNGDIEVESESGAGSKFTVHLALTRMEQPKRPVNYDFSRLNALVVDDDVSTCDYIKLLFDRCGASCMAFTAGKDAVEAFAAAKTAGKPFNVCLVDWRMPGMDGFATISEIRRIAANDLPIVVVTAYDFSELAGEAEKLGVSRFISKPLFQSSLFDLLATVSGEQPAVAMEKGTKYDFDGARVLLVEDNNMNMEVAKRLLLSAKIAVDSAWNGQEAYDIFMAARPGTYRAILMDVHMPEVDGYEATRMIRTSGRADAETVPIIAMTADVFAADIAEAHAAGMNDHIAKPIDVAALFQMLSTYLEGSKQ